MAILTNEFQTALANKKVGNVVVASEKELEDINNVNVTIENNGTFKELYD